MTNSKNVILSNGVKYEISNKKRKFNKKGMFRYAWKNAKYAAKLHGGKPSQYFSECLKLAYKDALNSQKHYVEEIDKATNKKYDIITYDIVNTVQKTVKLICKFDGVKVFEVLCNASDKFTIESQKEKLYQTIKDNRNNVSKDPLLLESILFLKTAVTIVKAI